MPAQAKPKIDSRFDYLIALGFVTLATLISAIVHPHMDEDIILLLYVLCAVIVATICKRRAAILAAIAGVASFDFFFVPPVFSFAPTDIKAIPVLVFMLVVSLVVSELANGIKQQTREAIEREQAAETLFYLSRDYANSVTIEDLVASAEQHLGEVFNCEAILMIPGDIEERYIAAVSGGTTLGQSGSPLTVARPHTKNRDSGKLKSLTGKFAPIRAGIPIEVQLETAKQRVLPRSSLVISGALQVLKDSTDEGAEGDDRSSGSGGPPAPGGGSIMQSAPASTGGSNLPVVDRVSAGGGSSARTPAAGANGAITASSPPAKSRQVVLLGEDELQSAQKAFEENRTVVLDKPLAGTSAQRAVFAPLSAMHGRVGVLGLFSQRKEDLSDHHENQTFLDTVTNQTALAIERAFLTRATREAFVKIEREKMRSALLSSVSHDLRTPLASIMGAASSIREGADHMDDATREELAQSIFQESERLNRLVGNLLDMTRLESGFIQVKKEWSSVEELIGGALTRLERRLVGRRVAVNVPFDLPLIELDEVLVEQLLYNLIENAVKYSGSEHEISISAWVSDDGKSILLEVANEGAPIPVEDESKLFEKFYRGTNSGTTSGAGLGLAICRAIVEAHGGRIWVEPGLASGVKFRFNLPLSSQAPEMSVEQVETSGT